MFDDWNTSIFNVINQFAGTNNTLDLFMKIMAEYLPLIFIVFLIFLWFYDQKYKNIVLYSGYSTTLGLLFNFLITLFYFHSRPFMDGIGTQLISHVSETSFPSDHTTFMISIAFSFLWFYKTKIVGFILLFLGFLGGFARVFAGIHYPFDIFGSFLIALVSVILIFKFRGKIAKVNNFFIETEKIVFKKR